MKIQKSLENKIYELITKGGKGAARYAHYRSDLSVMVLMEIRNYEEGEEAPTPLQPLHPLETKEQQVLGLWQVCIRDFLIEHFPNYATRAEEDELTNEEVRKGLNGWHVTPELLVETLQGALKDIYDNEN